jgi:hypothetical protein
VPENKEACNLSGLQASSDLWCRRPDLNRQARNALPPQDSVSTNSTTSAGNKANAIVELNCGAMSRITYCYNIIITYLLHQIAFMRSARQGQMYRFRNDVALTADLLKSFDNLQSTLEQFWICCCYGEQISGEWHIVISLEGVPATHTFRLDLRTVVVGNFFGLIVLLRG